MKMNYQIQENHLWRSDKTLIQVYLSDYLSCEDHQLEAVQIYLYKNILYNIRKLFTTYTNTKIQITP